MMTHEGNLLSNLLTYPLGSRAGKPRTTGLTMVIDKGLGPGELEEILETSGSAIDYLKFGFGTACLYPNDVLRQKLRLARLYSVIPCTGGTLAEVAMWQDKFEQFVDTALSLGFAAIEVSDGTLSIDAAQRTRFISYVASRATVVSEVGKKLESFPSAEVAVDQILKDLDAGAAFVIVEGRESGENVGIYGRQGEVAEEVLNRLVQLLPTEALKSVMWEAPKKAQQVELLSRFGQDVNLGNIAPSEVIPLECLRVGLRGDTFAWSLKKQP